MATAREKLEAIEEEIAQHEADLTELHHTKFQLETEIKKQEILNIEAHIPYYQTKLERLKAFLPPYPNLKIVFKKVDTQYADDWYHPMRDPLDWTIREYDMLGMDTCVDITFEYYTESVKTFVEKWWAENNVHQRGVY